MRIDSQPAYILHCRDYRDSSLLVEFLTPEFGRVSGVVRGVRTKNKSARLRRSLMQPFVSLVISWSGNTDLKTITHYDSYSPSLVLKGKQLFSAMYVNELLTRLLQHYVENPEIYTLYQWVLHSLVQSDQIEVTLRRFELRLLEYMGYGFDFETDCETGERILPDQHYRLTVDRGFSLVPQSSLSNSFSDKLFSGQTISRLGNDEYDIDTSRAAKHICRMALRVHLGDKPLKSRELFAKT